MLPIRYLLFLSLALFIFANRKEGGYGRRKYSGGKSRNPKVNSNSPPNSAKKKTDVPPLGKMTELIISFNCSSLVKRAFLLVDKVEDVGRFRRAWFKRWSDLQIGGFVSRDEKSNRSSNSEIDRFYSLFLIANESVSSFDLALFFDGNSVPFPGFSPESLCRLYENWKINSPILFLGAHSVHSIERPQRETSVTEIVKAQGIYGMAVRINFLPALTNKLRGLSASNETINLAFVLSTVVHSGMRCSVATPLVVDYRAGEKAEKLEWQGKSYWWHHNASYQYMGKTMKIVFAQRGSNLCYYSPINPRTGKEIVSSFGEKMGQDLIKRILRNHFRVYRVELKSLNLAKEARQKGRVCLFHSGSAFNLVRGGDYVWGTGVSFNYINFNLARGVNMHAVRGNATWHRVSELRRIVDAANGTRIPVRVRMGDPISLISFTGLTDKRFCNNSCHWEICYVPEFREMEMLPSLLPSPSSTLLESVKVIYPNISWNSMLNHLELCKFVICSDIYCNIASDAIGVPNRHLKFEKSNLPFSFREELDRTLPLADYYDSTNRPFVAIAGSIRDAIAMGPILAKPVFDRNLLLQSFPYHLFRVENTASAKPALLK